MVDEDLAPGGMPRFGKYVTPAGAELIRAYVAKQAAMLYASENQSLTPHRLRWQFRGTREWTIGADGRIDDSKGHFNEAEYGRQLYSES